MCGKKQAETYVRPTVIKQERTTALDLVRNDVDDGRGMGLVFNETTDCCDDHPVNIILTTQKHVALHFVPLGTLPSCVVAGCKDLWYPVLVLCL